MKYYMVKKLYERAKKEHRHISSIMAQALNEYITRNEWQPIVKATEKRMEATP